MWICDGMSSCYMLISRSQGSLSKLDRPQTTLLPRLPPIDILTRYQVLPRLLLPWLHSRLEYNIQRRPSRSLLRETFLLLLRLLFFNLITRLRRYW